MPIVNGKYVNPGWVNDTTPAINAAELNAMSTTLEKIPIANGGTNATNASGARTNLGFGESGSSVLPVYFDASGLPVPIDGPLGIQYGGTGTGAIEIDNITDDFTFYKWGKLVICHYRAQSSYSQLAGGLPLANPSWRPSHSLSGLCPVFQNATIWMTTSVRQGSFVIAADSIYITVLDGVAGYPRFDVMWFTN